LEEIKRKVEKLDWELKENLLMMDKDWKKLGKRLSKFENAVESSSKAVKENFDRIKKWIEELRSENEEFKSENEVLREEINVLKKFLKFEEEKKVFEEKLRVAEEKATQDREKEFIDFKILTEKLKVEIEDVQKRLDTRDADVQRELVATPGGHISIDVTVLKEIILKEVFGGNQNSIFNLSDSLTKGVDEKRGPPLARSALKRVEFGEESVEVVEDVDEGQSDHHTPGQGTVGERPKIACTGGQDEVRSTGPPKFEEIGQTSAPEAFDSEKCEHKGKVKGFEKVLEKKVEERHPSYKSSSFVKEVGENVRVLKRNLIEEFEKFEESFEKESVRKFEEKILSGKLTEGAREVRSDKWRSERVEKRKRDEKNKFGKRLMWRVKKNKEEEESNIGNFKSYDGSGGRLPEKGMWYFRPQVPRCYVCGHVGHTSYFCGKRSHNQPPRDQQQQRSDGGARDQRPRDWRYFKFKIFRQKDRPQR